MIQLGDFFDKVYIISLERCTERRQRLLRQLNEIGFYKAEIFDAVDGAAVGSPGYWSSGDGGWGCLLSHAEVARRAIKDGLSNYLVFEDDAILDPKFDQLFDEFVRNVPYSWDQFYLGGEHLRVPDDMGNGIFKGYDINRGHAYALSRKNFSRFHSLVMDHSYHGRNKYKQWDHHLGVAHSEGLWNAYAPYRWMVGQGSGYSDIAHMDLLDRWWDYSDGEIHTFLPFVIIENDGNFAHVRGKYNRGKVKRRKGEVAKFLWPGSPLASNRLTTLAELSARKHLGLMPKSLNVIAKGAFARRRLPCIYAAPEIIEMTKRSWPGGTVRLGKLGNTGEEIRNRLEYMCDYPYNGLLNMEARSKLPR